MGLSTLLNRFMNIYLKNKSHRVDATSEDHILICNKIVDELNKRPTLSHYYIKGSDGIGTRTFYPWVCIMNSDITRTPQKGLYIAFLFKKDMSGFYLALNQGITFFKEKYKSKGYAKAQEAARYFKEKIVSREFVDTIHLGGIKGDNGYGFEKTTVISRLFAKESFSDEEIYKDLDELSALYDDIIATIDGYSYEGIIPNILADHTIQFENAEKAIDDIKNVIYQALKPHPQKLTEVTPKIDRPTRFKEISTPSNRKIDYLKRAKENAETGLLGEKLVLEFEIDRLNRLGLEEYAKKIEHVAINNDVLGYDIKSFDIDNRGIHEIYIEVKTSATQKDVDFFVSKNEVNQSLKLEKDYWLYRVYDCSTSSNMPKFYRVQGAIENNFYLNPETYKATLKKEAKIVQSDFPYLKQLIAPNSNP
ncbi:MAG TPA: DUF3578 domain-containing protein [Bacilli bacterium]|nr:DUF3578 domain-containing protein [Bacilli bacterium]